MEKLLWSSRLTLSGMTWVELALTLAINAALWWSVAKGAGNNTRLFTGKERDSESGLDNFGARYDSSSMGRFLSPDWSQTPHPVPYADPGDPQSLNSYSYASNNPLSAIDRTGHAGDWLDGFKRYFNALVQPLTDLRSSNWRTRSGSQSGNSEQFDAHTAARDWTGEMAKGIKTIDDVYSLADVTGLGQTFEQYAAGDTTGAFLASGSVLWMGFPGSEEHHLLPQEFATQFGSVGLNIEDYTIRLSRWQHRLKPFGLHTGAENWNAQCRTFFRERSSGFTKEDVLTYLEQLKKKYIPFDVRRGRPAPLTGFISNE